MSEDVIKQFKKEYEGIQRIEKEENAIIIYADDDTLWKILEDLRDDFNLEFEAGAREDNFVRIMKN